MKGKSAGGRLSEESSAQTTIELFMVLAVSFVALATIYVLYSSQVFAGVDIRDSSAAKAAVERVVSAANFAYLAGPGSQMKIWIQMPDSANLSQSSISGKNVMIELLNGTDVVAVADINIVGSWMGSSGGYYMWLTYDGNSVIAHYNPFEINKEGVFALMAQGDSSSDYFLIRNNTDAQEEFWITKTFSDGNVIMQVSSGYEHFVVAPKGIGRVDINFVSSSSALGNYAGSLLVTGMSGDTNYVKGIAVSAEVVLESSQLTVYPKSASLSGPDAACGASTVRSFAVCNSNDSAVGGVTWSKGGTGASLLSTSLLSLPSSVGAKDCRSFLLTFDISGPGNDAVFVDLNANYSADRNYSSRITINKNGC